MKKYKDMINESVLKSTPTMRRLISKVVKRVGGGFVELSNPDEKLAAIELGLHDIARDSKSVTITSSDVKRLTKMIDKSLLNQESLPSNVHVSRSIWTDGLKGVIAAIGQKTANHDQVLFAVDSYDIQEFGGKLKGGEVLVRVSTPLTKNGSSEHRSIAKINPSTGKIVWLDFDAYENDDIIKWERPLKLKFLTIDDSFLEYFKIW